MYKPAALFLIFSAFIITNAFAVIPPAQTAAFPKDDHPAINGYMVKLYLALTPKKFYQLTGKKLSLLQKISLKLSQKKIRRMIKRGEVVTVAELRKGIDTSDFHPLGFLLGFLLPVVGLLIAYLVGGDVLVKWAWIGTALSAVIILLLVLL